MGEGVGKYRGSKTPTGREPYADSGVAEWYTVEENADHTTRDIGSITEHPRGTRAGSV